MSESEIEALEITLVKAAVEAILITQLAAEAVLSRQLQAEIRLESVDLTEKE